ncbi:MAG TPA: MFS transporter [Actinobacteria bacterium]|uniref:MFS transporter n=1 Tax=Candidatus Nanopelagicus sp. TaxID=2518620 RepID=UPI000ECFE4EA|nr:MFS transporter [Actinomycetota bacterium]
MKNFDKTVFTYKENKYLSLIFFLFGISMMSLAPRTPDLKANLAVNNGTFGTLLSAASLGSIVMLLIGGQIIHTIGAKNGLRIGSSIIALSFVTLVHTRSPLIFLIANICAGAGISIYHIASSGHTLHRQDEIGKIIIPKLHGSWAIGAMSTSAIAFFISDYVSIAWHLTTLMICTWLVTQYCVTKLSITFPPKPDADDAYQLTSIKQFKFKINWLLSIGFFCSSILEFTIADWATLFGKEELGMGASVATLSYLFYLVGLIIGRFSIGWALNHQSEQFWIKTGGLVGGLGFASALIISTFIVDLNKNLAFVIAFSGFFLAGLGSSAMTPMFFSIAGRLSDGRNALAVAQLSFINAFAIYVAKTTLAWVAQLTSITVALMFTGLIMSLLIYFGKVGSNQRV